MPNAEAHMHTLAKQQQVLFHMFVKSKNYNVQYSEEFAGCAPVCLVFIQLGEDVGHFDVLVPMNHSTSSTGPVKLEETGP